MRLLVLAFLPLLVGCTYDFDAYLPNGNADGGPVGGCAEPGARVAGDRCYFPTAPLDWAAAKKACEGGGAHLATVTSGAEEAIVESIGTGNRWIGLSRPAGSGTGASSFKWVTGEAVTYLKWAVGQPSGAGECGQVLGSGGWGDDVCNKPLVAICERQ